jgi:outer membrane protein assembly factor BamB
LNAGTGALVWSYPAVGSGSVGVGTGRVYLAASDNTIYALNAASGALIWQYQPQDFLHSSPIVANGVVYGGYNDYFRFLSASTGALLGTRAGSDQGWTSATVANGIVYVGISGGLNDAGALYAFSLAGQ